MPADPNPFGLSIPDKNWTSVGLLSILLILSWELLKSLAPKAATAGLTLIRGVFAARQETAEQERIVRRHTSAIAETNWVTCLPALSSFHLHAAIKEIYQPLKFRYYGGTHGSIETEINTILEREHSFAIVGPPGSGKSTVASVLASSYAKDIMEDAFRIKDSRLPLFVALRQLPVDLHGLPETLVNVFRGLNCHLESSFLKKQLVQDRCVLIFDGLDEAGDLERRARVVQWLVTAMAAYPKNRVLVTCRTSEWEVLRLPGFPAAQILPLNSQQCEALRNRWLAIANREDGTPSFQAAEVMKRSVPRHDDPTVGELWNNPLMLTISIVLALRNIEVPAKRSTLYLLFIRTLIGEWDRIKALNASASNMEVERRLLYFERLAGQVAAGPERSMEVRSGPIDVHEIFGSDAGVVESNQENLWESMSAVGERAGLLVRTRGGRLAFSSRPLFEVLVAQDALNRGDERKVIAKADDDNWSEIIVHMLELCTNIEGMPRLLCPDGRDSVSRLTVFGRAIFEALERGLDMRTEIEAFTCLTRNEIDKTGRVDKVLSGLAWRLQHVEWHEWATKNLQSDNRDLNVAVQFLAAVDLPDAIDLLRRRVAGAKLEVKERIADSLSNTFSTEATSLLWSLATDDAASAVQHLIKRGSAATATAAVILNTELTTFEHKTTAIQVLSGVGDAAALEILLKFARICDPRLHFAVWQHLYEDHLAKLGQGDEWRFIDEVRSQTLYARFGKRLFDLVLAAAGLLVVAPLVLIIALAIRVTSPGPMFFRQLRVGKDGKAFPLYKFRTMYHDAEAQTGARWAASSDPRIAPLGRWLRKFGLDALPQLINIVRGDLSFVGPWPELPGSAEGICDQMPLWADRVRVVPGLIGLAQVEWAYGATVDSVRQILVFDLYYSSHCSFLLDLRIMFKAVRLALSGR